MTSVESPKAAAAAAVVAAAPTSPFAPNGPPAAGNPNSVGFATKKMAGGPQQQQSGANHGGISPERMAYLEATLAKLPELDLSEMARVKACFSATLGEGRENIVNGLELRVVLGELGLYPSEEELSLVLRAYRDRVNLVGLARYLRLYKKEFWLKQVAARSQRTQQQQQQQQSRSRHQQSQPQQLQGPVSSPSKGGRKGNTGVAGGHTYTAFSGSQAAQGSGGSGGGGAAAAASGSDDDTLKAFVALGGEEDGSGEISATTLRDAVRGFGLTLDIDAMIKTVDIHHSGMLDYVDFCALWAAPSDSGSGFAGADGSGVDSMGNALRQASADAEHRASLDGSPFPMSGANRRLLSVLLTPSHRTSLVGGAAHRRSLLQTGDNMTRPQTSDRAADLSTYRAGQQQQQRGGGGAVTAYAPVMAAALPAPLTEEEHALLVRMYLFPEQFESTTAAAPEHTGRRGNNKEGTRFALPARGAHVLSPNKNGTMNAAGAGAGGNQGMNPAPNGVLARRASTSQRGGPMVSIAAPQQQQQQQLSRSGKGATKGKPGSRSGSQRRRGNNSSGKGRRNKDDGEDAEDDLAADFFSPKNQNVYRPPSPMLLSMRNSTAYRNRVKRLEEQKQAARGGEGQQQQQQRGLHAATAARDGGAGGYGYGRNDNDGTSRQNKASTW